jgi:V/A-type H+/Na+-transporting ATPase subunit F
MKIMVIGNEEAVLGFSLVGVEGKVATSAVEINQLLDEAFSDRQIGIVLITSDVAARIESRMNGLRLHSTVPLVVEIPAPEKVQPEQSSLSEIIFRAIGVRI